MGTLCTLFLDSAVNRKRLGAGEPVTSTEKDGKVERSPCWLLCWVCVCGGVGGLPCSGKDSAVLPASPPEESSPRPRGASGGADKGACEAGAAAAILSPRGGRETQRPGKQK